MRRTVDNRCAMTSAVRPFSSVSRHPGSKPRSPNRGNSSPRRGRGSARLQDGAGDGHTLALTARELHAAFAHHGGVAAGQRLDELGGVRKLCGAAYVGVGGLRPADADVVAIERWKHRGSCGTKATVFRSADCDTASIGTPPIRIRPPRHRRNEEETRQRRLAAARPSDEAELRGVWNGQRQAVEEQRWLSL
jgi:hypothetical protein